MSNQQNNLYPLIRYFEFINENLEAYQYLGLTKELNENVPEFIGLLYQIRALLIAKNIPDAIQVLIAKYPEKLTPCGDMLRRVIFFYKENPDLDYEDNLDNKSLTLSHNESVSVTSINDKQYNNILAKLEIISNEQSNQNQALCELKNKQELDSLSPVTMHNLNTQVNEIFKLFDELRSNLLSVHNNMLETKKIAKESIEQVEIKFRNYSEAFTATVQNIPGFVEESQVNLFKNKLSVEIEEMTTAVNAFISKYDKLMVNTDLKVQQNIEKTSKLVNNSVDLQREKIIGYYATATKRFLILVTGISIIAAAGIGFTSAKYIEHSFINVLSDVAASAKNKK